MPPYLYCSQEAKAIDQSLQAIYGEGDLMACAGRAIFELANKLYPDAQCWAIICGPGNNGGDGYIAATLASMANKQVHVYATVPPESLSGDALEAAKSFTVVGSVTSIDETWCLPEEVDLIIDALLGIGLTRNLEALYAKCVLEMNAHTAPVIAVDVPSGLNATTGSVMGVSVLADHTMSFIVRKQGLYTGAASCYVGERHFDDLGVTSALLPNSLCRLMTRSYLKYLLPRRDADTHKHACGHVLIVGGDQGMPGSVILAGRSALRAGVGLVSIVTHPDHAHAVALAAPELMAYGLHEGDDGLDALLDKADAVVVGPGIVMSPWCSAMVGAVFARNMPMVIDAGALDMLKHCRPNMSQAVCTPHVGEAARLLGQSYELVQQDRFAAVSAMLEQYGGTVVLKGAGSLVGHEGMVEVCPFGTPGLATAGTGDALAGMIGAFLAQGCPPAEGAVLGVGLHGLAGEMAAEQKTARAMVASDVIEAMPQAFLKLL